MNNAHQKIVAVMRTKNSVAVLDECLTKLSELVDEIIVMDNGSTDGTLEVLKKFPKITVTLLCDDTGRFHEGRDQNALLDEARKRHADWITMAWPDEVFEKHLTRKIIDGYIQKGYNTIGFRMCHFWLSLKYCRLDRDWFFYTLRLNRFMWRDVPGTYFDDVVVHAGSIPNGTQAPLCESPFRVKHYGYVLKQAIIEKVNVFRSYDTNKGNNWKYESANPDSKMNEKYVIRYPFLEFDNSSINYSYIQFYKFISNALLLAFKIKKRFIKIRIFPGER